MMRPATAKGHPKLSKGHSKDNSTPSGRASGAEHSDFKVSGKELGANSSAANLPRYRSIQMNVEDGPQNEKDGGNNQDAKSRRISRTRAGDGSGATHHSQRHPQMGVKGFSQAHLAADANSPPASNV